MSHSLTHSLTHLLREKNTPDWRASSFSQAAFLLMVILVSSRMVILSVTPVVVVLNRRIQISSLTLFYI